MATQEEIFEQVKGILSQQLGVDEDEVTIESSFQADLDADSLDLVELIMELEDQFGVKISDEEAQKIGTVGQAVDFVLAHQSSTARAGADGPAPGARFGAASGARPPRLHPRLVDGGSGGQLRAAGVPRGRRARSRRRRGALPGLPGRRGGPAREAARPRRVAPFVRRRRARARPRRAVRGRARAARRRAGGARHEPQRPGRAARGRDRRRVRRLRLRAHRRGGRRRLPRAHHLRLRDLRRSQDGAAGTGGTSGALRKLRADGVHRPPASPQVHDRRPARRRRPRHRQRPLQEDVRAGRGARGARPDRRGG